MSWKKQSTDPQAQITVFSGRGLPTPPSLDSPHRDVWSATTATADSVEAQQTLMLPGAANFVASTSAAVTADTRESLYWVSPQGVRYGIEWDQSTLQALGIDPAARRPGAVADRADLRRRAGDQPARRALLARDTIDAGGAGPVAAGGDRRPREGG